MKEYKIDLSMYEGKVREVVSEAIQRHAFKLGYGWLSGGKSLKSFGTILFFGYDGCITHGSTKLGNWASGKNTEISAADFLALTPEDVQDKPKAPKEPEFKPFDRVLVRDANDRKWHIDFFEGYYNTGTLYKNTCLSSPYRYCIPYEGNEHLLGTTEAPK
jgi:hypothetical protein